MPQAVPSVDLQSFPILAKHVRLDPREGDHTIRGRAICEAVGAALGLPAPLALDQNESYATLSYCGVSNGAAVEYRIRVLGFAFGAGSHKATEYLAISFVGLNAAGEVVGWSEDVQKSTGTKAYWEAVNAGKPPPPPKKGSLRDCALLTFVSERAPIEITPAIRALVAELAPAEGAPPAKTQPSAKKSAPKKPATKR